MKLVSSISQKVALCTCAIVLSVAGLFWALHHFLVRDSLVQQRRDQMAQLFASQARVVDELSKGRERFAGTLARAGEHLWSMKTQYSVSLSEPQWRESLSQELAPQMEAISDVLGAGLWFDPFIFGPGAEHVGYRLVRIGAADGVVSLSERNEEYSAAQWYQELRRAVAVKKGVVWSSPARDPELNKLVLTTAAPILNRQGEVIGIATASWDVAGISSVIHELRPTDTAQGFLIDPRTATFVSVADRRDLTLKDVASVAWGKFALGLPDSYEAADLELAAGARWFHKITLDSGLIFGLSVPQSEALATVIAMTQSHQALAVVGLVISLMIVFPLSALVLRPLKLLSLAARRISEGDLSPELPTYRADEIGVLIEAFGRITAYIREIEAAPVGISEGRTDRAPTAESVVHNTSPVTGCTERITVREPVLPKLLLMEEQVGEERLSELLRRLGYPFAVVPSREEMEELLGRDRYDLVLIDVATDEVRGGELCAAVRGAGERHRAVPIVIFTDAASANIAALTDAKTRCIERPKSDIALVDLVCRLIAALSLPDEGRPNPHDRYPNRHPRD